MLFSDALGQLRNSLDNFVFSVLTPLAAGNKNYKSKEIKFPIVTDKSKWKQAKKAIDHIPEPFLSRIESIQPFQHIPKSANEKYGLTILQKLSNSDKHNLQILPSISTNEINHEIKLEFESLHDANISMPPKMEILNPVFENGAHLLKQSTAGRIYAVTSRAKVTSQVIINIDGDMIGITALLAGLWEHTAQILYHIADLPAKAFEDWANNLN
jgi:hypothetical protein